MSLPDLGWTQFFNGQLDLSELEDTTVLRLSEVRRRSVVGLDADFTPHELALTGDHVASDLAVGDFVLCDDDRLLRVLERKSVISRKAAGLTSQSQLIAANVDSLLITSSCNADFNAARIERYLALALEADIHPVIVLTKADTPETTSAQDYAAQARAIYAGADVIALNAKDADDLQSLEPYCGAGKTIALVGSSGVGKSTIARGLTGKDILIGDIREDDAKGRHTTTARSMHQMLSGGWLIDTPGMRELALHDSADGISALFEDILELAAQCKFSDCQHETEPKCAVRAAIESGELDPDRLERWRKLSEEDERNSETVAQAREKGRKFAKTYKAAMKVKAAKRGE